MTSPSKRGASISNPWGVLAELAQAVRVSAAFRAFRAIRVPRRRRAGAGRYVVERLEDGQVEPLRTVLELVVTEALRRIPGRAAKDMAIDVVAGGFELRSAEPIVLCCGESRLELRPDGIVLHAPRISAECPDASLVLERSAATLRANTKVEIGADVLAAVGTSITAIKGSTCEIEGSSVDIKGERVTVEATNHIDIVTVGEVDIHGTEKIKLN